VPLNGIVIFVPVDELLETTSWPVAEPAEVGSNCSVRLVVWPGLSVTGSVDAEIKKPAPVTVAELTVTAAVPVDDKIKVCVVGVLTETLPNGTLVALMLSVGTAAFNWSENPIEAPPALAVRVAVCAVLTDDTVAVNPVLVEVAGTVTEEGSVTALLLLERLTTAPPLGADPVNVTVHASVPAPVMDELVQ
jgi:hypothetical protein